ncbi:alpha/beta hydrolase [Allomuricauda taeanensis]|uniref:alpha/beta fold hydrolase n=1 Tax=Flagellimonas taeanensis TaxID=1005926 RepID=UPI002E7C3C38|nr:alpha/beta hydrolase [Allomuricauda taeanensis]MEE1963929.1 alpha/beta hydrolase [Allomuricauda taeanensis]
MIGQGQKQEFIKNKTTVLNTTVYSVEKAETIILLHGGPGVPDEMFEVVELLKNKYRVITFEQRGVGSSACKGCQYKIDDYITDIDSIVKHCKLDEFHLFGHSWGGLYAQIYAAERPDKIKSLFLCSPSSGTNTLWKATEREVMQFNKKVASKKEWLSMGWNSMLGMLGSDKAYGKVFKQVLKNYHAGYNEFVADEGFLNKIHSQPINETRKEIVKYKPLSEFQNPGFPIQITYGDNDIYGESKNELIKRFPTAKVETIKNCGHIPWKHNLKVFETILSSFYQTNRT